MNWSNRHPLAAIVLLATLVGLTVGGLVFGEAYLKAAAYRRATGKQVSVWDAVFLDLRVQEPVTVAEPDG